MILTGTAIAEAVERGAIRIDPFDPGLMNPNSYNYRLGETLRVVPVGTVVDPTASPPLEELTIPADGFVLEPGRMYLGTTVETIGSDQYVPSLIGRSSLGRLGLFLQVSADLGQLGALHRWTLEIVPVQAIRVYPRMRVGQVSFWEPTGEADPYTGFYGFQSDPTPHRPGSALPNQMNRSAA
jgi:dCTP deaminase